MDTIQRASVFFQDHGRDIDQARFGYHFGTRDMTELVTALSHYQNPDGGFGQGLENDIAAPDSNPFATELALMICLQAGVAKDHPLLQRTVEYLELSQDEDGCWRFSPAIYRHELAPWFENWEWPNLNPACPIAGLLIDLGLGSARLHRRVEQLFERLGKPADLLGSEYYSVRPYAYYFLAEWEHPQRELYLSGVVWWLLREHFSERGIDGNHFFDYVRRPDTYVGKQIPEEILTVRLEALMAEQQEDGGWPSPYSEKWRGWVTVQNLLTLRAFNWL